MTSGLPRPESDEFDSFYTGYVSLVPQDSDVRQALRDQLASLPGLMITVSPEQACFRYEVGKWSIKEVIGHLTDVERTLSYRLLRAVRGDKTQIPGFAENDYVDAGGFDARALGDLVSEWEAARHSSLALIESVDPGTLSNRVVANDAPVTGLALLYIIAGHTQHHLEILRARYGVGAASD